MNIDFVTFLLGALFCGLPLVVGVVIGMWLMSRRQKTAHGDNFDLHRAREVIERLSRWMHEIGDNVVDARSRVDHISTELQAALPEPTEAGGEVDSIVTQLAETNAELRTRLDHAEQTLREQAVELEEYLSEARTDSLTQLPNRRAFDEELTRRFAEFRRGGQPLSVLIMDLDHFKQLNDTHGHTAGDRALEAVSACLAKTLREYDMVARFGGEEFAVVLPGTIGEDARRAAERARVAIDDLQLNCDDEPMRLSISYGLAESDGDEDATNLVSRADDALYASKHAGRNCGHWHDGHETRPVSAARDSADDFGEVCGQLRRRVEQVAG